MQPVGIEVQWVGVGGHRGGLVFKAHRLVYHSTLGSRVIKKVPGHEGLDGLEGNEAHSRPGTLQPRAHLPRGRDVFEVIRGGRGGGEASERERERERERETTGYEPFALHAPIHWAIEGYVIKSLSPLIASRATQRTPAQGLSSRAHTCSLVLKARRLEAHSYTRID